LLHHHHEVLIFVNGCAHAAVVIDELILGHLAQNAPVSKGKDKGETRDTGKSNGKAKGKAKG